MRKEEKNLKGEKKIKRYKKKRIPKKNDNKPLI